MAPIKKANVRFSKAKAVKRMPVTIDYSQFKGIDDFVTRFSTATPMQRVDIEKRGVEGIFLKDISKHMGISAGRLFDIVGVPKATAEKKAALKQMVSGNGGHAALGLARLLGIARLMVKQSTAKEAEAFDTAKWLGQWLECPQAALGGSKPADLIGTPTGLEIVTRLLGAIESGSYQ